MLMIPNLPQINSDIGPGQPSSQTTVEILVIEVGATLLGVNARQVRRLRHFRPEELKQSEQSFLLPGFLGFMGVLRLPILDLSVLMGLGAGTLNDTAQVLVLERQGQSVGFAVGVAQEIERAELQALYFLPPLIEQMRLKPVVWALWQQTPDTILPLVNPLESLSISDWEVLTRQLPVINVPK